MRLCIQHMSDNILLSEYKHLTDVQIMQCLILAKNNWTVRAIANEVGCSKTIVGCAFTDHDYNIFTVCPKSAGDPAKQLIMKTDSLSELPKQIIIFHSVILLIFMALGSPPRQLHVDAEKSTLSAAMHDPNYSSWQSTRRID